MNEKIVSEMDDKELGYHVKTIFDKSESYKEFGASVRALFSADRAAMADRVLRAMDGDWDSPTERKE